MKEWEKLFQPNGTRKQPEVAVIIAEKTDIKQKLIREIKKDTSY